MWTSTKICGYSFSLPHPQLLYQSPRSLEAICHWERQVYGREGAWKGLGGAMGMSPQGLPSKVALGSLLG